MPQTKGGNLTLVKKVENRLSLIECVCVANFIPEVEDPEATTVNDGLSRKSVLCLHLCKRKSVIVC